MSKLDNDSTMMMLESSSRRLCEQVNIRRRDQARKEGELVQNERSSIAREQVQRRKTRQTDRGKIGTHCNTSKLNPAFDDRIIKVFTIVFLFLWLFFEIDIRPARKAHLVSIVAFRTFGGR